MQLESRFSNDLYPKRSNEYRSRDIEFHGERKRDSLDQQRCARAKIFRCSLLASPFIRSTAPL